MKTQSIGQLAKNSGVSIRTLRHYDDVGLLHPSYRADNGYRFYSDSDSQRLHDILFYRALGFSLNEIKQLLSVASSDRRRLLLEQREQLNAHITRLERMQIQLDEALSEQDSAENTVSTEMKQDNQFDVFDGFDPDSFAAEAEERWGDTDAYKESKRRTSSYSDEDWQRYRSEWDQLNQDMVQIMKEGCSVSSERALEVVEKMRLLIDQWFYPCSKKMYANLGEMYVADERFTATYDKVLPGLATYIRDAAQANVDNS